MTIAITNRTGADRGDTLAASFATSYAGVLAFIAVVNEGSFAKAGDRLGIGRSAVSRSVQRLEAQLDARLFNRTTRNTTLTGEGELFFARCQPGVTHIAQAFENMRELRQGMPRGLLRVSSAATFGRKVIAPLLAGFHAEYPEVAIELLLDDAAPDFVADRIDVSFRNGRLEDSQVVAKRLAPMRLRMCASPEYVRQHGVPGTLDELLAHRGVHLRLPSGRIGEWEFDVDGSARKIAAPGRSIFNDDELVLQAVLDGEGIAQLAAYQICAQVRSGQLVTFLDEYAPEAGGHYLCYLSRQQLPSRIRVFIDYMTEHVRAAHDRSLAAAVLAA